MARSFVFAVALAGCDLHSDDIEKLRAENARLQRDSERRSQDASRRDLDVTREMLRQVEEERDSAERDACDARRRAARLERPPQPERSRRTVVATVPGGSVQGLQDLCWVISRGSSGDGAERLGLACYQVSNGRWMRVVGVRDISWDLELTELNNDRPSVADVRKLLKK